MCICVQAPMFQTNLLHQSWWKNRRFGANYCIHHQGKYNHRSLVNVYDLPMCQRKMLPPSSQYMNTDLTSSTFTYQTTRRNVLADQRLDSGNRENPKSQVLYTLLLLF